MNDSPKVPEVLHSSFIVPDSSFLPEETRAMTLLMQKRRRRAAFTLIELMVVMAILTIMISLLLAGVSRVRSAAKRTAVHTEIRELGQGITMFKQKFSVDYVPSKIVLREKMDYDSNNPSQVASANYLKEAWPFVPVNLAPGGNTPPSQFAPGTTLTTTVSGQVVPCGIDWNGNGQIDGNGTSSPAWTLEGDQCLVFFLGGINEGGQLTGFSTNKRNPMDPTPQRIGPFIQFQVDRLQPRGTTGAAGFRSYIDPWKAQPYLYFTSYGKQAGYKATDTTLGVTPYVDPTTNKAMLSDGFQIICAGEDKLFGPGGTAYPATGPGEDDIANFSQGTLGTK
jgi:prepilin-type N-terminal cleavage/methylation domain-containing protein